MIRRTLSFSKTALKGIVIWELKDVIANTAWAKYQALSIDRVIIKALKARFGPG